MCERSQEGFFTIWASGNEFSGEVVGMGGEGTERGQSIGWPPTPKGAFTAPEDVGVIYLWMQILVLPLTGLF